MNLLRFSVSSMPPLTLSAPSFRGNYPLTSINPLVSSNDSNKVRIHINTTTVDSHMGQRVLAAFQQAFQDEKLTEFLKRFPEYYIGGEVKGERVHFTVVQLPPSGIMGVGLGSGIGWSSLALDTLLHDPLATVQFFNEDLSHYLMYGGDELSDDDVLLMARMAPHRLDMLKDRCWVQINRAIQRQGFFPEELKGLEGNIKKLR